MLSLLSVTLSVDLLYVATHQYAHSAAIMTENQHMSSSCRYLNNGVYFMQFVISSLSGRRWSGRDVLPRRGSRRY